jgi:hypothetical protein
MQKLTREQLMPLEEYHLQRSDFRRTVMSHKELRQIAIGPHATLYFEDRLTVQYQVQEMLRVERIFEAAAIQEELDAYNPLIPDGNNWKATFMIEYEDADERQIALTKLVGVEDKVWARVGEAAVVWAIADEDLERSRAEKTSAVHFLRFQFTDEMVHAAQAGAGLGIGIDHPAYNYRIDALSAAARAGLVADFG